LYIGLDDTDTLESRGTGHLARQIAAALSADCRVLGVTRHQLLVDPRVPYTKKNSCAAVLLDGGAPDPTAVLERVQALMLEDFQPGSDPGLCVTAAVPPEIAAFGRRVQREVVTQAEARALAKQHGLPLLALGGDCSGIIGALAAVGLAAGGEDGRYVLVGRSRDLCGAQPIPAVLAAGIDCVCTVDGQPVTEGVVEANKMRPARREGRAVLYVEREGDHWLPLKLD